MTTEQLRQCGVLLLRLLFDMKHNGAVDKAHLGLAALAQRLQCSPEPTLSRLPREWLEVHILDGCQAF